MSFNLEFTKMSGSGNDFILIDNRNGQGQRETVLKNIERICEHSLSVGADGVIFIENSDKVDFKWGFFNSDGSEGEMCGNGSRCAARFAFENGVAGRKMAFETLAGVIRAEVKEDNRVVSQLTGCSGFTNNINIQTENRQFTKGFFLNTGVPHAVFIVDDLETLEVEKYGRQIRNHSRFAPAGTNVNFISVTGKDTLRIRTYERGVEGETLACGTGSVAAVISAHRTGLTGNKTTVIPTGGGTLCGIIEGDDLFLEGEARIIYKGFLCEEAFPG